ncbi:hypothetical protein ABH902_002654 [Enterococcus sp. UD-01]
MRKNDQLQVVIDSPSAEMHSIHDGQKEYLWQANAQ